MKSITYTLDLEDLVAFSLEPAERQKRQELERGEKPSSFSWRHNPVGFTLAGLAIIGFGMYHLWFPDPNRPELQRQRLPIVPSIVAGLMALALIYAAYRAIFSERILRRALKRQLAAGSLKLAETTLSISADGIVFSREVITTSIDWPGIKELTIGNGRLFILTGPNVGLVVPARAFPSPDAYQSFCSLACDYKAKAGDRLTNDHIKPKGEWEV